jgi:LytS/YehU family sensor histidine kinase
VGLENIRSRLNGYFGGQAELSFNNVETGTEAQLMIPVVEQVKPLLKNDSGGEQN